jgi:tetraacyldisaccharide 4'-kinase
MGDLVLELFKRDIESQDEMSPWYVRVITWPLSLVMQVVVWLRHQLYDRGILPRYTLPGVTISVGNIAVGGTGKSPMVMEVVRTLTSQGARCAVLTRGYGSNLGARDWMVVQNGAKVYSSKPASSIPDEARMQSVNLPNVPIIIGHDRLLAATRAVQGGFIQSPNHWILDDGFQHRRLTRHLDIVLLDAERPVGNGHLLPRGNLREPLASLRRAGIVFLTRAKSHRLDQATLAQVRPYVRGPILAVPFLSRLRQESVDDKSVVFDMLKYSPLAVVCGIARPQVLVVDLLRQGIRIESTYFVGDHQPFDRATLLRIAKGVGAIVTTEKDYYRDPAIFAQLGCPVFLQELYIDLDPKELSEILEGVLSKSPTKI